VTIGLGRDRLENFMGHRSTLSGHIQEPYYIVGSDRAIARLWHHNRRVLRSLPLDDKWPFLSRRMMNASPMFGSGTSGLVCATYRGPVIHFGGSFSSLFEDWTEWLEKFESLLRRLYWEHAVVVLVTEWMGQHVCRWDADKTILSAADPMPPPVKQWVFTGPREI
jgi:hypothetical protein